MAIQWGSTVSGSNGVKSALGIQFWGTEHGSPVRAEIWLWTNGFVADNYNTLTVSGSHSYSGSVSVNIGRGGDTIKLTEIDVEYPATYGQARSGSVSASLTEFAGGAPTVSASWTVEAKPYSAPRPVMDLTAVRQTNDTIRVSWVGDYDSWQGAQPVWTYWVGRQTDGVGEWVNVATLSWDTTSWTDISTEPGHSYAYQVYAGNTTYHESGAEQWSAVETSNVVYTAPLAPGNATAVKRGADVIVSWVNRQVYGSPQFEVGEGEQTLTPRPIFGRSFTVSAPSAQTTHTYWVRAVLDGVVSEKTYTNLVQLAAAPHAPTMLTSGWAEQAKPVMVTWEHNPADGSAQSSYQVRHRVYGSSSWTELDRRYSSTSSAQLDSSLATGAIEWSVRTWGQDSGKAGPWSSPALIQFEKAPTVTITAPSGMVTTDTATVEATVSDVAGAFSWEVTWSTPGAPERKKTGYGTESVFTTLIDGLQNGKTYTVAARARAHIWGTKVTRQVKVVYASPPAATLKALPDLGRGSVALTPSVGAPGYGEPAVERIDIQRLDGDTWVTIATDVAAGSAIVDPVPPLVARVEYRAVTFAATGTSTHGAPVVADLERTTGFHLNWGRNWGNHLLLKYNPVMSESPTLVYQAMHHFAGRTRPVAIVGTERSMIRSFSAAIMPEDTSMVDTVRELAYVGVLVRVRSAYQQLTTTGVISGVKIDIPTGGAIRVSFTHEEAD